MQISRSLVTTILLAVAGFSAKAQREGLDRQSWVKANLYSRQDAVDFINTSYKDFTPVITKHSHETGIYRRTVKLKGCELVIATESRDQKSSWKNDREFDKDIVVIELNKVSLSGNDLTPSSADNADGLFSGPSFGKTKKIPAYSILTPVINKDSDRFAKLHYEEHLQWAYQFLIDECGKK